MLDLSSAEPKVKDEREKRFDVSGTLNNNISGFKFVNSKGGWSQVSHQSKKLGKNNLIEDKNPGSEIVPSKNYDKQKTYQETDYERVSFEIQNSKSDSHIKRQNRGKMIFISKANIKDKKQNLNESLNINTKEQNIKNQDFKFLTSKNEENTKIKETIQENSHKQQIGFSQSLQNKFPKFSNQNQKNLVASQEEKNRLNLNFISQCKREDAKINLQRHNQQLNSSQSNQKIQFLEKRLNSEEENQSRLFLVRNLNIQNKSLNKIQALTKQNEDSDLESFSITSSEEESNSQEQNFISILQYKQRDQSKKNTFVQRKRNTIRNNKEKPQASIQTDLRCKQNLNYSYNYQLEDEFQNSLNSQTQKQFNKVICLSKSTQSMSFCLNSQDQSRKQDMNQTDSRRKEKAKFSRKIIRPQISLEEDQIKQNRKVNEIEAQSQSFLNSYSNNPQQTASTLTNKDKEKLQIKPRILINNEESSTLIKDQKEQKESELSDFKVRRQNKKNTIKIQTKKLSLQRSALQNPFTFQQESSASSNQENQSFIDNEEKQRRSTNDSIQSGFSNQMFRNFSGTNLSQSGAITEVLAISNTHLSSTELQEYDELLTPSFQIYKIANQEESYLKLNSLEQKIESLQEIQQLKEIKKDLKKVQINKNGGKERESCYGSKKKIFTANEILLYKKDILNTNKNLQTIIQLLKEPQEQIREA